RPAPRGEEPQVLRHAVGYVRRPELGLVDREGNDVDRNVLVGGDGLDHQKAFGVRERIRLRKMTHWITRLLFDAPRIGIRGPAENGLGAPRRSAHVREVSAVDGLEPAMHHRLRHYRTRTPAPPS